MRKESLMLLFLPLLFACNFSFSDEESEELETEPVLLTDLPALHDIYKDKFLIGNVISPNEATGTRFTYLRHHFNVLTAENAMKPDATQAVKGKFTYSDALVSAATTAGAKIHGHTLVWHSQTPAWMTEGGREAAIANMETHIKAVMEHYKGKVISWDVVNEAIDLPSSGGWSVEDWKSCLRKDTGHVSAADNSRWYGAIGADFVELAFLAARAADPDAKLYYNDFSLDNQNKARAVANMVKDINERYPAVGGRKLIDGVGMQAHYSIMTDPNNVKKSIEMFIAAGVEVSISELDIQAVFSGSTLSEETALLRQGSLYAQLFTIFAEHSAQISRVTFWGLDDAHSWRQDSKPLLFDAKYNAKPAFYGVQNPALFLRDHPW